MRPVVDPTLADLDAQDLQATFQMACQDAGDASGEEDDPLGPNDGDSDYDEAAKEPGLETAGPVLGAINGNTPGLSFSFSLACITEAMFQQRQQNHG